MLPRPPETPGRENAQLTISRPSAGHIVVTQKGCNEELGGILTKVDVAIKAAADSHCDLGFIIESYPLKEIFWVRRADRYSLADWMSLLDGGSKKIAEISVIPPGPPDTGRKSSYGAGALIPTESLDDLFTTEEAEPPAKSSQSDGYYWFGPANDKDDEGSRYFWMPISYVKAPLKKALEIAAAEGYLSGSRR